MYITETNTWIYYKLIKFSFVSLLHGYSIPALYNNSSSTIHALWYRYVGMFKEAIAYRQTKKHLKILKFSWMFPYLSWLGNSSHGANIFPYKIRNILKHVCGCDFSSGNNCFLFVHFREESCRKHRFLAFLPSESGPGNTWVTFPDLLSFGKHGEDLQWRSQPNNLVMLCKYFRVHI
jgi:hypothetical protein